MNHPPSKRIVSGDILAVHGIIVHQCNCTTTSAAGLAKHIFEKYPSANTYKMPRFRRQVGTCNLFSTNEKNVMVANLNAQNRPGQARADETLEQRLVWFDMALADLARQVHEFSEPAERTIYFPYGIGCGLAGGTWHEYLSRIDEFAKSNPSFRISIVKL